MSPFDVLAYSSRLKTVSPACKAGFALFTMVLCLFVERMVFSVLVAVAVSVVCVVFSGVPLRRWLRLCAIPFSFLLIGCVTVAISFSQSPQGLLAVPFFGTWLTVTKAGLLQAAGLFCKAAACVCCLYFLSVTTPLSHVLGLLERLHAPALLVELMLLIYRFIFILADVAAQMVTAQKARLGNASYRASLRSLVALMATLFVRAMQKSARIFDAMESRGYTGGIGYIGTLPSATPRQLAATTVCAAAFSVCGVAVRLLLR